MFCNFSYLTQIESRLLQSCDDYFTGEVPSWRFDVTDRNIFVVFCKYVVQILGNLFFSVIRSHYHKEILKWKKNVLTRFLSFVFLTFARNLNLLLWGTKLKVKIKDYIKTCFITKKQYNLKDIFIFLESFFSYRIMKEWFEFFQGHSWW